MAQNILRSTRTKATVKVSGNTGAETIAIGDLAKVGEDSTNGSVSILGVQWTGAVGGVATITRGTSTAPIMVLAGEAASSLNLVETECADDIQATESIKVAISGGEMAVYLLLRKEGYTVADPQQYSELPY